MWVSQGNNECFHTLPWKLTEQPSHQLRACFSLEWPLSNLTFQLFFWILFPLRHLSVAPAKEAGKKAGPGMGNGFPEDEYHIHKPGDASPVHKPALFLSRLLVSFSPLSLLPFLRSRFNDPSLHGHVFFFRCLIVRSFVSGIDASCPLFLLYFSFFPFFSLKVSLPVVSKPRLVVTWRVEVGKSLLFLTLQGCSMPTTSLSILGGCLDWLKLAQISTLDNRAKQKSIAQDH